MARYGKSGSKGAGKRPTNLGVLMNQGGKNVSTTNACGNLAALMEQGKTPTSSQVGIGNVPRLNTLMKQ